MHSIAAMVYALPSLIGFGCVVIVGALLHCLVADDDDMRLLPKPAWILIILLLPWLGAFLYLVAGRRMPGAPPRRAIRGPRPGSRPAPQPRPRRATRPVAPDDDPAFLAELGRRQQGRDGSGEQA